MKNKNHLDYRELLKDAEKLTTEELIMKAYNYGYCNGFNEALSLSAKLYKKEGKKWLKQH